MASAPLEGVKVVEVSNWLAAPAAAAMLADLGASVVKVEPPDGDAFRHFNLNAVGYQFHFPWNVVFEVENRGKRSMTLDLEHPDARKVFDRLVADADIFITNLVPGRRDRFGLTYEQVRAVNPKVIYTSFSGYGVEGPEKDRLGFDYAAFWAGSGIMSLIGEPGGPPALQRGGMGDHTTSLSLLSGILTAYIQRLKTGEGQLVDVSLLNTGLWVLAGDVQAALLSGEGPARHDRMRPANPLWNTYETQDGRWVLLVMPQPDPYWPKMCAAMGRPDLQHDERYDSMLKRRDNSEELRALFEQIFATRTLAEWGRILDENGLIWAPVQSVTEVIEDPQALANRYFYELEHPTHGKFRTLNTPFKVPTADVQPRSVAPELGQHTEEVLLEAGYTWEDIGSLRDSGVLG